MAIITVFKNYYFRIIIKNLTKCNILNTFAFKNYGKFANHVLESCILGLWLWPRPFLCLASEGLSSKSRFLVLALASDFFRVRDIGLDLERCVLDSTSVNTEL